MNILLAYGTKHGSTREVTEAIAETLGRGGHECDVRPAAGEANVAAYDGVIVGGSLYVGRFHPDAVGFLERNRHELATIPFAVFAMGPKTLEEADVADSHVQLGKALAKFADLSPSATTIFGGVVDPEKLRFPLSRMPASDARDWEAIAAWAEDVATSLAREHGGVGIRS
jgi:menaquinone-dependent protoporphyrinogen oxidase